MWRRRPLRTVNQRNRSSKMRKLVPFLNPMMSMMKRLRRRRLLLLKRVKVPLRQTLPISLQVVKNHTFLT